MPNINIQDYSWFKEKKSALVGLIRESSRIINDISLTQHAKGLSQLGLKVDNDTFKIQVIGTFNNGKSTLINAILGEDILPTKILPCTAVINEIKYGDSKKAILNFRNPLPKILLSDIPEVTLKHMKAHGMKNVPPMEIDYDRISDYVTIPVDGDPEEISLKSPYFSVELFYPSVLLKEGVEIIDSPGLNESDERTTVTLDYLAKADAVIFLLDATRACAKDEMDTIDSILIPKGFDDMFFVVNRFDMIKTEKEQAEVKCYVKNKVKKYTTNEIFYISALNALDGKIEHNQEKFLNSGFMPLETRLTEFLTKDKGRIKLAKPAKELKQILTTEALFKAIPSQRAQISTDLQVLRERYESVKPELDSYESQKETLKIELNLKVERKENNIRRAINSQFREIADSVPAWIADYEPVNGLGIFAKKKQVEKVAQEIREHVSSKVKDKFAQWEQGVLIPLIEESMIEIFETSDNKLKGILDGIDQLQSEITGTAYIQDTSSGWTRALGIAGICCGFVSGASLLSGQFDIKTLAKSLAVDLGIGTGLLLLGITNPVVAIAGVVVAICNAVAGGHKVAVRRLKEQQMREIRDSIIGSSDEKSKKIVNKIDEEFKKHVDAAINAINIKIRDLKTQVETVLREKEENEVNTARRMDLLAQSESKLHKICGDLDDFVFSLVENS